MMAGPMRLTAGRLRMGGAAGIVLAGIAFLAAYGVAAVPRIVESTSDQALRAAVRDALPVNRNISFERAYRPGPSTAGLDPVRRAGRDLESELPESIHGLVQSSNVIVDTPHFEVRSPSDTSARGPYRYFMFRYHEGAPDRVRVVEGRMPSAAVTPAGDDVPVYETAISFETARALMVTTGDRVVLTPHVGDSLNLGIPASRLDYRLMLEISGIFTVNDPEDDFWFGDRRLEKASTVENPAIPDEFLHFGSGLLNERDYDRLMGDTHPSRWSFGWRFTVDPDRLAAQDLRTIESDLRELELRFRSSSPGSVEVRTGLSRIAEAYRGQQRLAGSVLSLLLVGVAALVLGVAMLLAALRATRMEDASRLLRSRGASQGQLLGMRLAEGLLLFMPAALAAYALAVFGTGETRAGSSLPGAVAVALVFAGTGAALAGTGEGRGRRIGTGRRLVVEAVIVTGAVVGLVLLRRRGIEAGEGSGVDLFLATVPVLAGLALGVVVMRVYPVLVNLVGGLGFFRGSVVGFVGVRRLATQPASARLPLLVMLVAVALAVFGSVVVRSISEGQLDSAWQQVGADFRIESLSADAPVSRLVDLSGVDAVEAPVAVLKARPSGAEFVLGPVPVIAVDPVAYSAVAGGTRADPALPSPLLEIQPSADIGSRSNPIPAVVSAVWPGTAKPAAGDLVTLNVGRYDVTVEVVEVRPSFPGFEPGGPFIVVPQSSLQTAGSELDLRATRLYLRAPDGAESSLRRTINSQSPQTLLISRNEVLNDLAQAPLSLALASGHRFAIGAAGLLAALAAVAGIALTADERNRDLAYLRILGLPASRVVRLTVVEQLPPAVVAIAAGGSLGLTLAWLTRPGLDLSAFTGMATDLSIDVPALLLLGGGMLVVVTAAAAIYSYVTRRVSLDWVLRIGDRL